MKKFLALIGIIIVIIVILAIVGKKKSVDPITLPEEEINETEEMNIEPSSSSSNTSGTSVEIDTGISIDTSANAKTFTITGKNFEYSTKEIRVKQGNTVTINFSSTDGFHDWVVDEFEGAATARISTGQSSSITFIADKTGTFEFYCSVGNHRDMGMVGKFIVEA